MPRYRPQLLGLWTQLLRICLAEVPDTGVHVCRGRLAARQIPAEAPRGFEACSLDELPAGFSFGFRATLPPVDMPRYLGYLTG